MINEELTGVLEACHRDFKVYTKTFFPEIFFVDFTPLHNQMIDAIESGHKKIAIAAPRGLGKTTTMVTGLMSKKILFRDANFITYINQSSDAAVLQTENLKRELLANQTVRDIFGTVKSKDNQFAGYEESFSKKSWVAKETLIFPRGAQQQVRGILYNSKRPDYILCDDLENKDLITNELYRIKLKEWFYSDVLKCVSRFDKNYQIVYIDTLKHEDSLLQSLLDSDDWYSIRLEAFDDDLVPTAPGYMDQIEVREEYETHKREGMLDVLFREFRNLPISTDDPVFDDKNFRYYREHGTELRIVVYDKKLSRYIDDKDEKPIKVEDLTNVTLVDPAKTVKLHSAESAVVGVGVSREDHRIFVRDIKHGFWRPNELYDKMFEVVKWIRARVLGVEVTSLHEFISQPIKNDKRLKSIFCEYLELLAKGKKEERIAWLAPYYNRGYIYHNISCCTGLESQLIGYPRSKKWDIMDAFAYIVKVMEVKAIYFDPIDSFGDECGEDEFDELEYANEKVFAGIRVG